MRNRQSIRLQNYDYSKAGMYFITICTYNDEKLFGNIIDGIMRLNDSGEIAYKEWYELRDRFNIELNEFVIMPNHIHGIIEIIGENDKGVINNARTSSNPKIMRDRQINNNYSVISPQSNSLSIIIRSYKSCVTRKIRFRRGVIHNALKTTNNIEIWHRNFHERIIRSEIELNNVRQYIIDNPKKWKLDKVNLKIME